jgi:hypothetical protein
MVCWSVKDEGCIAVVLRDIAMRVRLWIATCCTPGR